MDYAGLSALIVLALLFALLTIRALRARRGWVRLAGGIAAGLLALLFGAATVLALAGYAKINTLRANPVPQLQAAITPQLVADGERFARTCAGCHSSNGQLPLNGQNFAEGGPPIGTLYAPNLTPAHLRDWSDGEIIRAIREGVGRDGRSLIIMPSSAFHNMSDQDVLVLVAYLRSQPAVEPASPPRSISVLGAIMFATVLPDAILSAQPPITAAQDAPPRGPTAAYGGYLVTLGCQDCHGANLAGGVDPGNGAVTPNLSTLPQRLSAEELVALLRTGLYPDGRQLSDAMPWRDLEKMSDDDFRAIYAHLESAGPLPDNP